MGMILTQADIAWMEDTVREVIDQWNCKITIFSQLPESEQTNYNALMNEFVGPVYVSKLEIDAERKDIVNNMTNNPEPDSVQYGKKNEGTILYAIPDVIDGVRYKPSVFDVIKIDDTEDLYYIRSIRDRIGETLLTVRRFTGVHPVIVETEDYITIKDYGWCE